MLQPHVSTKNILVLYLVLHNTSCTTFWCFLIFIQGVPKKTQAIEHNALLLEFQWLNSGVHKLLTKYFLLFSFRIYDLNYL